MTAPALLAIATHAEFLSAAKKNSTLRMNCCERDKRATCESGVANYK